jgi:drug/metabolite transporter (DMT)-like permease
VSKIIIALYILATSSALVLIKLGSKTGALVHFVDSKVRFNFDLYNLSGVALYGISFLLYVYLISKYDLGYIIPLTTAFVYTLIFIASFFIFKEAFTIPKVIGIIFIIIGLAFLNLKK